MSERIRPPKITPRADQPADRAQETSPERTKASNDVLPETLVACDQENERLLREILDLQNRLETAEDKSAIEALVLSSGKLINERARVLMKRRELLDQNKNKEL